MDEELRLTPHDYMQPQTRKLSYRKDDRAMRPIQGGPIKTVHF